MKRLNDYIVIYEVPGETKEVEGSDTPVQVQRRRGWLSRNKEQAAAEFIRDEKAKHGHDVTIVKITCAENRR
jgi:hypothetical protein